MSSQDPILLDARLLQNLGDRKRLSISRRLRAAHSASPPRSQSDRSSDVESPQERGAVKKSRSPKHSSEAKEIGSVALRWPTGGTDSTVPLISSLSKETSAVKYENPHRSMEVCVSPEGGPQQLPSACDFEEDPSSASSDKTVPERRSSLLTRLGFRPLKLAKPESHIDLERDISKSAAKNCNRSPKITPSKTLKSSLQRSKDLAQALSSSCYQSAGKSTVPCNKPATSFETIDWMSADPNLIRAMAEHFGINAAKSVSITSLRRELTAIQSYLCPDRDAT
eukprot:Blabericola_migrator_1__4847@NODE_2541_length_2628_cov_11_378758_g1589_i0_p2_GENE_NODE_2541_length_2628_cov_11_378758_g1589_i0NODE_2541_length_2628_cov_11_378758_g1589_i0_p2_ORF_typecomplete_len281_score31_09_NODE_2541_length_2628_cov_11_378758_g1589_i08551697